MQNGGQDGVIIGVSNLGQLESNLKDLEKGPLPDDVIKAWLITKPTTAKLLASGLEVHIRYLESVVQAHVIMERCTRIS